MAYFNVLPLLVLLFLGVQMSFGANAKPNFVVFVVDDMGYSDLGCFGRHNVSTPNVDRLAREGVKFTQWIRSGSTGLSHKAVLRQYARHPVRACSQDAFLGALG